MRFLTTISKSQFGLYLRDLIWSYLFIKAIYASNGKLYGEKDLHIVFVDLSKYTIGLLDPKMWRILEKKGASSKDTYK